MRPMIPSKKGPKRPISRDGRNSPGDDMSDDTHDPTEFDYISDFQDVLSQRAIAFCNLAKLADSAKDPAVKELCLTMMRKISASVKTPSTAEVRLVSGGARPGDRSDQMNPTQDR